MDEYVRFINKNTELFSTQDPDVLLEEILNYAETQGYKDYKVSKDKYKIKLPVVTKVGEYTEMTIEILKADQNKVCIDFTRAGGDTLPFYNEFNLIKEYLGELIDTTY